MITLYYCVLAKVLVIIIVNKPMDMPDNFPIDEWCDQPWHLQKAAQFPMETRRHAVLALLECTDNCADGPAVVHALLNVWGVQCGHHSRL